MDETKGTTPKRKSRWRPKLRALHRDIGYVAVGLTFVYALSGLAVNHIADWEPNFTSFERIHQLTQALPPDDQAAEALVRAELGYEQPAEDLYRTQDELELVYGADTQVIVTIDSGQILERGREARPLLRVANWLHLNRGKKAWTYVADAYALFLIFLATSGMFMLPGKKGLRGRGWVLVSVGVALPVLYVLLSGGPS